MFEVKYDFYLYRIARTKCVNPNLTMFLVDIATGEMVIRLDVEKTKYETVADFSSIPYPDQVNLFLDSIERDIKELKEIVVNFSTVLSWSLWLLLWLLLLLLLLLSAHTEDYLGFTP